MTLTLTRVTRKYRDATAEAKARTTQRLRDELAEERISRELVQQHNERVRERRSKPYYVEH